MAKVKVSDLRTLVKNEIEELDYNGLKIEVQKYLPITQKLELVATIYSNCIDMGNAASDNDGDIQNDSDGRLRVVNGNSKEIAKVYFITKYYTNITLPKDIFEAYDILISTGLYTTIENTIYDEIISIEKMLDEMIIYECEKNYQKNKPMYILKEFLDRLVEKIPTTDETRDLMGDITKELESFDPNKMKFIKDFIELNSGGKNEN